MAGPSNVRHFLDVAGHVRAGLYAFSDAYQEHLREKQSARAFRKFELTVLAFQGFVAAAALGVAFLAYWATSDQAEYGLRAAKSQALTAGIDAFARAQSTNLAGGRCVRFLLNLKFDRKLEDGVEPVGPDLQVSEWTPILREDAWHCMGPRAMEDRPEEILRACPTENSGPIDERKCIASVLKSKEDHLKLIFKSILPYQWYRTAYISAASQLNAASYLYATLAVSEPAGNWGDACEALFYTTELMQFSGRAANLPGRRQIRELRPPKGCLKEFRSRDQTVSKVTSMAP